MKPIVLSFLMISISRDLTGSPGFLPDAFSVVGINIVEGFRADQFLVGIAGEFFVKRTDIDKFALLDNVYSNAGAG